MGAKRSTQGASAALVGFIAGYLTALVQRRNDQRVSERRDRILIGTLHKLVKHHARHVEVSHDEAGR